MSEKPVDEAVSEPTLSQVLADVRRIARHLDIKTVGLIPGKLADFAGILDVLVSMPEDQFQTLQKISSRHSRRPSGSAGRSGSVSRDSRVPSAGEEIMSITINLKFDIGERFFFIEQLWSGNRNLGMVVRMGIVDTIAYSGVVKFDPVLDADDAEVWLNNRVEQNSAYKTPAEAVQMCQERNAGILFHLRCRNASNPTPAEQTGPPPSL